jgi:hypothetical protein
MNLIAKSVYFGVGDEMRLVDALQVASESLHEIGRDDLRAELREFVAVSGSALRQMTDQPY